MPRPKLLKQGRQLIHRELDAMPSGEPKKLLMEKLERIKTGGERDLYY